MLVEARWIRPAPDVDRDVLVAIGLFLGLAALRLFAFLGWRDGNADHVHEDRVAVGNSAIFDRLVARRAFAQLLERLFHGLVVDADRLLAQREARVIARVDWGNRFERGRELQRLAFLDDDILNVRCVDGFHTALPQCLVHRPRDEPMRHIVKDLVPEPLPHHLGGYFPGPEARNAGGAAVVPRHFVDLGIDDGARDFDDEVFLGVADVYELSFHRQEVLYGESMRKGGVEPP